MRIPTSRHDPRYRRRQGPAATSRASRKLLRLVLAMVLVIMVMRQAADPRIYEALFGVPPQVPVATPPSLSSASGTPAAAGAAAAPGSAAQAAIAEAAIAQAGTEEDVYQQLVAALDAATAEALLRFLARADVSRADWTRADWIRADPDPADGDSVSAEDQADDRATPTPLPAELQNALEAAVGSLKTGDAEAAQPPVIRWDAAEPRRRLLAALDRWAIERVDPAAIWKSGDSLAFYRLLQEPAPAWLMAQNPAQPGVISLLQQPEVYLHRRVVILGSVARAIARTAAENPFGVTDYWELWLRPRDGSERPLVVFAVDVPPAVAAVGAEATLHEGPLIWWDGVYLKRLAYNSAAGRELAPALVGRLQLATASGQAADASAPLPSAAPPWATSPEAAPRGWMLVALAAVLAIAVTLLIYYQTTKEARRARALRQASLGPARSPPVLPQSTAAGPENAATPPRPADESPAGTETEPDR